MKKVLMAAVAIVALIVTAAVVYGAVRNPESGPVDSAARAGAPGKFITLSNGVTHYELLPPVGKPDTGRVVVLVHGFSVPYYIWDSSAIALTKAGRRVLRYDMFGRGLSDRPDVAYDGAMYDAQLRELLDSLRITQPIDLVGLSFGGYVTSHFAGTHRARVNTLTMVDPTSTKRVLPGLLTTPIVGAWFFQTMAVPGMADGQSSDFLHPERFPGWADRYRPQMQYDGFGRALLRTAITLTTVDFPAQFAAAEQGGVPTLLIWGKQDPTLPFANAEIVRAAIPSLTFVPIDSAGHLPHMEQSAATHAAMLEFFKRHP